MEEIIIGSENKNNKKKFFCIKYKDVNPEQVILSLINN